MAEPWVGYQLWGWFAGRTRTPGCRSWEAGPREGCWTGPGLAEQQLCPEQSEFQPRLPFLPLGPLPPRTPCGLGGTAQGVTLS